jgi:predicted DNA-binding ribbon-helix-helix protein
MQSEVLKRSIVLKGRKTSVSLENAFWFGLKEIAADKCMSLGVLVAEIDSITPVPDRERADEAGNGDPTEL